MQKEFSPIVEELENQCQIYFAERLVSAYLHGSIDKEDALPGVSDLDYFLIISDNLTEDDEIWVRKLEDILQSRYNIVDEVHLAVHAAEDLRANHFAIFTLKYNATLRLGTDITEIFALDENEIYRPDKELAKSRLIFAKKCFSEALNNLQPACTGELPNNTYYAVRKFARYFVIIEGAYFLMSLGEFHSFDKKDVMLGLRENCKGFENFFDVADMVLSDPIKAGIAQEDFLRQARPFMEWIFEQIAVA